MNRFKLFIAKRFFKELLPNNSKDASGNSGGATGRELASQILGRVVYKDNSDTDYEDPTYDLGELQTAYNTDSYIRQGVDKYVDQIFKEGYTFYGTDSNIVDYINLRLQYISEATNTPTLELLTEIAEDVVKYGNCMMVKARSNDPNAFPQGVNLTGLNGKDPVAGYFCANAVDTKCMRDDYGTITKWQQETDKGKQEFAPEDVVHFYYKREKGNAYGTSFLVPVMADIKALRRAEENVLKMMYRNIYPFYHVAVGTEDAPGSSNEVDDLQENIQDMDVEAMLVTTERVAIKPIASDKVINAEPYLKYMESRVFSGLGIPEIMFGRGDTSNRSTGDNMASEMADRIRAIQKVIEMFFNEFVVKELLMEAGYDPVLNPDQNVEFKFNDNDVDVEIKKQVHSIYKYEHSAITEDEMRSEIGMDPIPDSDREKMFVELVTRNTLRLQSQLSVQASQANNTSSNGNSETNNKEKNGGGSSGKSSSKTGSSNNNSSNGGNTKPAAKKPQKNDSIDPKYIGLIKDCIDEMTDDIDKYLIDCCNKKGEILQTVIEKYITDCNKSIIIVISQDKDNTKRIENKIIKITTDLLQGIHDELIGYDIYNPSNIVDVINVRVDIYKDSLVKYLIE